MGTTIREKKKKSEGIDSWDEGQFTSDVNHVLVLMCSLVPGAWSWVSSATAPGQLCGKWAEDQQVAQYLMVSRTSPNTFQPKRGLQRSPVTLLIKANYNCCDQNLMETHNQKKIKENKMFERRA